MLLLTLSNWKRRRGRRGRKAVRQMCRTMGMGRGELVRWGYMVRKTVFPVLVRVTDNRSFAQRRSDGLIWVIPPVSPYIAAQSIKHSPRSFLMLLDI